MFGWEGVCEFVSVAEQGGFTPAARKLVSIHQDGVDGISSAGMG